jgi:hypothetical protein
MQKTNTTQTAQLNDSRNIPDLRYPPALLQFQGPSQHQDLLATLTVRPSVSALQYKNPDVVERLQKKLSLTNEAANLLFKDTLKFLSLAALEEGYGLVPPQAIDAAWHHFILFTRDYSEFCDQYFGAFLHHVPSTSRTDPRGDRIPDTAALAEKFFGPLSENWASVWRPEDGQCSGTTNCQVCYR